MTMTTITRITREEVLKLAKISCIEIGEHEIEGLVSELQAILSYASLLKKVVQEYESLHEAQALRTVNIMRPDRQVTYDAKSILKEAPAHEENYFVVPLIVKQS